jgi:hypothetical protein
MGDRQREGPAAIMQTSAVAEEAWGSTQTQATHPTAEHNRHAAGKPMHGHRTECQVVEGLSEPHGEDPARQSPGCHAARQLLVQSPYFSRSSSTKVR